MKHYVFLKFHAGCSADELLNGMECVLAQAQDSIPGFEHYQVLKECNASGALSSVLIVLKFVSVIEKDNYLQHPLHLALLRQIKPAVTEKAVFDSED